MKSSGLAFDGEELLGSFTITVPHGESANTIGIQFLCFAWAEWHR